MKHVCHVVGARPQFVKLSAMLDSQPKDIKSTVIHTGQHYDFAMSGVFFRDMSIPDPDLNLNLHANTPGQQIGNMIDRLESIFMKSDFDYVVLYGDTNSTLAGAISAVKCGIPISHIEAGERTYNKSVPEEQNRIVTDHLSSLLFCASSHSVKCLLKEGIINNVFLVGDVMYDIFLKYKSNISSVMHDLNLLPKSFYLLTVHRQRNTDDKNRLHSILDIAGKVEKTIVFPIHPRTRKAIESYGFSVPKNVMCIDPVSYIDMVYLEQNSKVIITDSGGVQKEAYWSNVPCLILDSESDWVELIECGCNHLVDINKELIMSLLNSIECNITYYAPDLLYGDGRSSEKIWNILR